jgi:hypothetical protein
VAELAHWDGWALDIWLGWVEEEEAVEPPVVPPVSTEAMFFPSVEVVSIDNRRRKDLIVKLLLLG